MKEFKGGPQLSNKQWLVIIILTTGLTWLGGVGGFNWQTHDYLKHNLVFHDLAEFPWPVVYEHGGGFLCYYIGYYLVPSGLANLFAPGSWPFLSFCWAWVGLSIAGAWLVVFWQKSPWWAIPVFFLMGGWDWLGSIVVFGVEWLHFGNFDWGYAFPKDGTMPLDWGLPHNFISSLQHWTYSPQHALPAWLGSSLVLHAIHHPQKKANWLPSLITMLLLWSPFVALGLLPFAGWHWLGEKHSIKKKAISLLPALLIFAPVALYFAAHRPLDHVGFAGSFTNIWFWPALIVLFFLWETGAFWFLTGWHFFSKPASQRLRQHCLIAFFISATVIWFTVGYYNDLVLRVSMPAQFFCFVWVGHLLFHADKRSWLYRLAWGSFLLATLIPLLHVYGFYKKDRSYLIVEEMVDAPSGLSTNQVDQAYRLAGIPQPFVLATQYLGRDDSFFARYLMRRPDTATGPHSQLSGEGIMRTLVGQYEASYEQTKAPQHGPGTGLHPPAQFFGREDREQRDPPPLHRDQPLPAPAGL